MIGATPAARRAGRLVQHHPPAGLCQTQRSAQTGNAGPHDMHSACHGKPYRRKAPSNRSLLGFIRCRGAAKPVAIIRSRIER